MGSNVVEKMARILDMKDEEADIFIDAAADRAMRSIRQIQNVEKLVVVRMLKEAYKKGYRDALDASGMGDALIGIK